MNLPGAALRTSGLNGVLAGRVRRWGGSVNDGGLVVGGGQLRVSEDEEGDDPTAEERRP